MIHGQQNKKNTKSYSVFACALYVVFKETIYVVIHLSLFL
jgi:hypothetical protein